MKYKALIVGASPRKFFCVAEIAHLFATKNIHVPSAPKCIHVVTKKREIIETDLNQ